jgi:hypothetical protein
MGTGGEEDRESALSHLILIVRIIIIMYRTGYGMEFESR